MYLKEVKLENFKSFGKKKNIPFLGGFTVITGPNGSGKSNIADAILFVLGPKSSKAIRADKLTNLIWNGGKIKQPAKYCRVSLVFDNKDRIIPLEEDEVVLTRLVKISPSDPENYLSYFYVNGRKSTLAEFDDLLAHAQISAEGYNIVQQGDINRIVGMSNLERRRVLDGIAGVTRYDEDIKKAGDQRKAAEENLDKIKIIIDEINRQVKDLEKDRGKALKYKELKDEYNLAKAQSVYKRKESIEREILNYHTQIEEYQKKEKDNEAKVEELKVELEKVEEELLKLEEKIDQEGGDEAKELKKKIDEIKVKIAEIEYEIEDSKRKIQESKGEKDSKNEDTERLENEIQELKNKEKKCSKDLEKIAKELEEKSEALENVQQKAGKSDDEVKAVMDELEVIDKEVDTKDGELRELTLEEDRCKAKLERMDCDIAEMEERKKDIEFQIQDAEFSLKELTRIFKDSEGYLAELNARLEAERTKESKLYKEREELENAVKTLTRDYNRLKAEAEAAESIRKGFNMAVSSLLEARDKGTLKGIHGTIAELAEVEDKFEVALSIAAGARMQSIIVENDDCAAKAIEFLKQKKLGRATFLPLNKMSEGRPKGKALMVQRDSKVLGFAIDLIKFKPEYRTAFWYVFRDTLIVEDLKAARALMGGVRLVTLEGELIEAAGAMIGGTVKAKLIKFGTPSRNDIERIGKELRSAIEHEERVSNELKTVKNEIIVIENQIREHGTKDSSSEVKIESLKSEISMHKKEIKGVRKVIKGKSEELEGANQELQKIRESIESITQVLEKSKSDREGKKKELEKATPRQYTKKINELQKEVHELSKRKAKLESEKGTLEAQIKLQEERLEEIQGQLSSLENRIGVCEKKIEDNTEKSNSLDNELRALQKVEQSLNHEIKKLHNERNKAYESKKDVEVKIDSILSKIETNKDFVITLRTKAKNAEDTLNEAKAELAELSIDESTLENIPGFETLKRKMRSCENRMRELEPINMKAIEEYEAQQKRHKDLIDETKQLKDQRRNLIRVMKELEEKKKVQFLGVFEAIGENFKGIFAELSVEGEAELLLENPERPFEAGLIIKARPRGKKVLRLEALSGGEKSLTALALIFAIQHYEPSPFYLLDEVDMFLDAINAENVARMVKKNSRIAQSVMISLRKITMKEADYIYGVTMRDNSISDVIGNVNLQDVQTEDFAPPPKDEEHVEDASEEKAIQGDVHA